MTIVVDKTKKIHEQIQYGQWCQDYMCIQENGELDTFGKALNERKPVKQMCLLGWLHARYTRPEMLEILPRLEFEIASTSSTMDVDTWNDDPKRKFHQVKDLLVRVDL